MSTFMKTNSVFLVTLIICTLRISAASAERSAPGVDEIVRSRTGKQAPWQKDEAARVEARRAVESLLARPLTAHSAARVALLNNRALQAQFEEIGISQAELIEAGLLKNPTLDGMIGFPNRPSEIQGSLAEDLLDALFIPLRKRVAQNRLYQATLRAANEALKVIAETKAAWFEGQAAELLVERAKLSRDAAEASRELAQRQYEAGNISDLELATQTAAQDQMKLDLLNAEADLREKRQKLNRLMGTWGHESDWKLAGELPPLPSSDASAARLDSLAVAQRLDLAAQRAELLSYGEALGLTKRTRFLGGLELGITSGRDADGNIRTGPTLRLEIPIFNQGQGKVARGEAQFRQSADRLEALTAEVHSEVAERSDRVKAKRDLVRFYQETMLPERQHIVSLTLQNYNAMFTGAYHLLDAKQGEFEADRALIEARRDYWVARTELELAVGGSLTAAPVDAAAQRVSQPVRKKH